MKISDPGNVVRSQLATITFGCQRGQPTSSADGVKKVHVSEDPPASSWMGGPNAPDCAH